MLFLAVARSATSLQEIPFHDSELATTAGDGSVPPASIADVLVPKPTLLDVA